jgi:phage repressor protein C with HTH and peptisase S24 domain
VETDSNGAFALRVRGDSMELEFHEGDIIIVNTALKQEHNDYLVVSNEEGEAKAFPSPSSQINKVLDFCFRRND